VESRSCGVEEAKAIILEAEQGRAGRNVGKSVACGIMVAEVNLAFSCGYRDVDQAFLNGLTYRPAIIFCGAGMRRLYIYRYRSKETQEFYVQPCKFWWWRFSQELCSRKRALSIRYDTCKVASFVQKSMTGAGRWSWRG
jgi:hypothetical protein